MKDIFLFSKQIFYKFVIRFFFLLDTPPKKRVFSKSFHLVKLLFVPNMTRWDPN